MDEAILTLPTLQLSPAPAGALLTVVAQAVHQSYDGEPVVAEVRYERHLLTNEQPYVRWLRVNEQWQPLDLGWLRDAGVSYLVLANDAPQFTVNPSPEERTAAMAKVVEIAFAPPTGGEPRTMFSPKLPAPYPCLWVAPGEAQPLSPVDAGAILVRCRSGVARCTLSLFPR